MSGSIKGNTVLDLDAASLVKSAFFLCTAVHGRADGFCMLLRVVAGGATGERWCSNELSFSWLLDPVLCLWGYQIALEGVPEKQQL